MTVPADPFTQILDVDHASFIADNDDGTTTIHLGWPENPVGFRVNALRNMHRAVFAKRNAYWRDDTFARLALGAPTLAYADVWVGEVLPTRALPDAASCAPAVKAAIDGLITHAHLLADDTPEYLHSVTFASPVYVKGEAWLTIELRGPRAT